MVWLFSRAVIILYLMPLTPYQNPLSPHHCRPMLSDDVALAKFSQAQSFRACHSSCYTSFDSTIFRHALSCTPSQQIALLLQILKTTKGRLISKCPFSVFKSPKKPTKIFSRISDLASKKRANQKSRVRESK